MQIGVFTPLFAGLSLEEMLAKVRSFDLEWVEIGTGNYPGNAHCDIDRLLSDSKALEEYRRTFERHGIKISALSCHGNPLHPQREIAERHHKTFEKTVELAGRLGIEIVIGFSGCPGDSDNARCPNWITCAWPTEYLETLEWQWREKVIPYWQRAAELAAKHSVKKLAFEMHPGFVVYNPETLLKLRRAVGDIVGANLDPSHLFWQGIDIVAAIKRLGREGAIFHFHAKDTYIDKYNTAENGVLDTKSYSDLLDRSWYFRSVGYGHDEIYWKSIVSALRSVNYDYVLSIEHEDALASIDEGFAKSVSFLKGVILERGLEKAMWWA